MHKRGLPMIYTEGKYGAAHVISLLIIHSMYPTLLSVLLCRFFRESFDALSLDGLKRPVGKSP